MISFFFFKNKFFFLLKLVSTAMKFLSTLAARSHHCSMFEGGDTLKIVCEQVILPNLFLRGGNSILCLRIFLNQRII